MLTCGARLTVGPACQPPWCIDQVHLAVAPEWKFDFLYLFFIDFVANLQKLYLELGVSKWGEPNFVGFIMKSTI